MVADHASTNIIHTSSTDATASTFGDDAVDGVIAVPQAFGHLVEATFPESHNRALARGSAEYSPDVLATVARMTRDVHGTRVHPAFAHDHPHGS